ncbi:MAG: TlpA family protein disulfide reductase [Verrucomicrobiota bacterium]
MSTYQPMEHRPFGSKRRLISLLNIWLLIALTGSAAELRAAELEPHVTKANAALGEAFAGLLNSKDVDAFAKAVSPTKQELEDLPGAKDGKTSLSSYVSSRLSLNRELGKRLLSRAEEYGFDPKGLKFQLKAMPDKDVFISKNAPYVNGSSIDMAWLLTVVLTAESKKPGETNPASGGEYEIKVFRPKLFPIGWRITESAWWSRTPVETNNPSFKWETAFLNSIPTNRPPFIIRNDPAMETLGYALIRFMQMGEDTNLAAEAGKDFDEVYAQLLKQAAGRTDLLPKEELRKQWNRNNTVQLQKPAREMVRQMRARGIDLSQAEITLKRAIAEVHNVGKLMAAAEVNGISTPKMDFTFSVKSDQKTKDGKPIAGDYSIVINRAERDANHWTLSGPIAWSKLPDTLSVSHQASFDFEKYVTEHGKLPPGINAPDISVERITDGRELRLAQQRGKVVVLDFWASWCGPCQAPMAAMQALLAKHPEWRDRVEIITVSVDDTMEIARKHVQKQGWSRTLNTWTGEGGISSPAAQAFRVVGLPRTYLIDQSGKIMAFKKLDPEVIKDKNGRITGINARTAAELEEAITGLLKTSEKP